jgi:cold shock CspA family protein
MNGTIVYLSKRGFGSIQDADGTRVFFHARQVLWTTFDELRVGMAVRFRLHPMRREAVLVEPL